MYLLINQQMAFSLLPFTAVTPQQIINDGRYIFNTNFDIINEWVTGTTTGFSTNQLTTTAMTATTAVISSLTATSGYIGSLTADSFSITSLTVNSLTSQSITFTATTGIASVLSATTLSADSFVLSGKDINQVIEEANFIDVSWAQIQSLVALSALSKGCFYRTPYYSDYLTLLAIGDTQFANVGYSKNFPQDTIEVRIDPSLSNPFISGYVHFNPVPATDYTDFGLMITKRHDTLKNVSAPFDWRNVTIRRFLTGVQNSGQTYTGYLSWDATLSSSDIGSTPTTVSITAGTYQDFYAFQTSAATNIKNVTIGYNDVYQIPNIVFINTGATIENVIIADGCDTMTFAGEIRDVEIDQSSRINIFAGDVTDAKLGKNFSRNVIGLEFNDNVVDINFTDNFIANNCFENTFGSFSNENSIMNTFQENTVGDKFIDNFVNDSCIENSFGSNVYNNEFGSAFQYNTIKDGVRLNVFGASCSYNTIDVGSVSNTFQGSNINNFVGAGSTGNTFGTQSTFNTLKKRNLGNTIGNSCSHNTLGEESNTNTLTSANTYNVLGDSSTNNTIGANASFNELGDSVASVTINANSNYNKIGNDSGTVTIGPSSSYNVLGVKVTNVTIGNSCNRNTIDTLSDSSEIGFQSNDNYIGKNSVDVKFYTGSSYNYIYSSTNGLSNYDMDFDADSLVQTKNRFEQGFSNFSREFEIPSAGTQINITSFGTYDYLGELKIKSVSTAMTKNELIGGPQDHNFIFRPILDAQPSLFITLNSASPTTTTANLFVLDTANVTLDASSGDFVVFKADENGVYREQYRKVY